MASNDLFEFECPQYVDFTEIDCSPALDGELGGFSPDFPVPEIKKRTKSSRKKVKPGVKVNVSSFQAPICHSSNATDSDKWFHTGLSKRLSRSESSINLCSKNVTATNNNTSHHSLLQPHNRSLSENDIRTKQKMGPTTPMCLKRTLCRAKVKKLKTSEELELEKIAELQKQMHQHLRANEVAMKRLKLKTRPCTAKNEIDKPEVKSGKNFLTNLPKDKFLGKPNHCKQNTSPLVTQDGANASGRFATKANRDAAFMMHLNQLRETRCKQVSRPSFREGTGGAATQADREKMFKTRLNQLRETACKNLSGNQCNKQNLNLPSTSNTEELRSIENKPKPYTAHPGLMLLVNHQKATAYKPFNFDRKDKLASFSTPGINNPLKDRLKMRIPSTSFKLSGKENNKSQKSFTDVKKAKDLKRGTPFHSSKGKQI